MTPRLILAAAALAVAAVPVGAFAQGPDVCDQIPHVALINPNPLEDARAACRDIFGS